MTEENTAAVKSVNEIEYYTNLQDFDVKNRNQRYYDAQNIWECIQSEKEGDNDE